MKRDDTTAFWAVVMFEQKASRVVKGKILKEMMDCEEDNDNAPRPSFSFLPLWKRACYGSFRTVVVWVVLIRVHGLMVSWVLLLLLFLKLGSLFMKKI